MNTLDSEKTVLGSILYHDGLIRQLQQYIPQADDFLHSENRAIYSVMLKLYEMDITVNLLTVDTEMSKMKVGVNRAYLEELVENYAVEVNDVMSIAKQLSEYSAQRLLENKVDSLNNLIRSREKPVEEYVGMLEEVIAAVSKKSTKSTTYTGPELINSFMDFLSTSDNTGVLVNIPQVESQVFNFFPGEMIVVGARPGVGKTTVLLQGAYENMLQGKKVGIISLEMSPAQLLLRLVAYHTGVDSRIIRTFDPSLAVTNPDYAKKWSWLLEAMDFFEQAPIFIETASPSNISTVLSTVRKLKYINNIDIIYIDYIQLIESDNSTGSGSNRNAELTVISRRLKNLAGELEIPLVTAAQLSRAVESRVGQRPILSDLRESGAIEQDASMVIFLYPDLTNMEDVQSDALKSKLESMAKLPIFMEFAKARSGPVATFPLEFEKSVSKLRFRDTFVGGHPQERIPDSAYDNQPSFMDDESPF